MDTRLLSMALALTLAWQKDPDSMVSPVKVVTSPLLPAPDVTLGDEDTTLAGIADTVVGADDTTYDSDPPSSGTTFWVDNTPLDGDCPQATFVSIQSAVNASGPNDTVKVCPGTYTEQVQIFGHAHDGLRLESLTPLAASIQWPSVDTPITEHVLVHITNADGVSVRGFTIRHAGRRHHGRHPRRCNVNEQSDPRQPHERECLP
jgi:hypothetical protein